MVYRVLAVLVALVAGLFVLQNVEPVYVKFMFWNVRTFLAMALTMSFLLGFACASLIVLAFYMRKKFAKPGAGAAKP